MEQTAVEWLVEQLSKNLELFPLYRKEIEQAKEMEKQQIIDAQVDILSEHIAKEHFRKQNI